jgi:hypothetical protein
MNKDQEYKEKKDESLQPSSYLDGLLKGFHELGPHLSNLDESHHLDHSNYFCQFSYSCEPCDSINI